ncbi:MAG: WD40 repeat domain-containing protein, partial [Gemmataceae bacterium]
SGLLKYDLAAGKELLSVRQPDDRTFFDGVTLSPDGRWVVTTERKLTPPSATLLVLAADTLKEAVRIPGPKDADRNTYFDAVYFSTDGNTLITRSGGPLRIWDVRTGKMVDGVPVGEFQLCRTAASADGKRIAVACLPKLDPGLGRDPDPADLPQPRVLLVEFLAGGKHSTRWDILPAGAVGGVAFSPDGGTLAVGSSGGVHLLDVSARNPR